MPQIPHRIQPDTPENEKWALVNDNFDKTVQDISDLGAKFSSGVSASVTIAAGDFFYFIVGMRDIQGTYVKDKMPLAPRYDVAVDVNDSDHWIPDGSAVTLAQNKTVITQRVFKTSRNNFSDEKATSVINLFNNDTVSHTYYVAIDSYYQQSSNQGGLFR